MKAYGWMGRTSHLMNSGIMEMRSWQGFHLYFTLITKVISELWTKASMMGEWKRLCRIGNSFGGSGVPIAKPLELTHTWEEVDFQTKTRIETGFAGRLQKDSHGCGKRVKFGTVRAALGGVNAKIALNTGRQPLHQPGSNEK